MAKPSVEDLVGLTRGVVESLQRDGFDRIRVDEWKKEDRSVRLSYAHKEQRFVVCKDRKEIGTVSLNLDTLKELPTVNMVRMDITATWLTAKEDDG